jgi:hypothetical protein
MSLNGKTLGALLARIDGNLTAPATICLIGSGATIMLGQPARQTDDIDVWAQASRFSLHDLRVAAETAGMGFDPRDAYPQLPYLQIIHPGIVHVPGWNERRREWLGEPARQVWQGKYLTVTTPPPRIVMASKLVRGDDRDLEDCMWLMAAHALEAAEILKALKALPRTAERAATDNLAILRMMKM